MSLLEVTDLKVAFPTEDGLVQAVQGISFTIDAGQTLGIVGESGSGKSVSTQTIMGLTRGAIIEGTAVFEGRDLLTMAEPDLRKVRGAQIGMIFQDPLSSLHPQYRIGWQIVEMIQAHEDVSKKEAAKRAVDLLGLVGIAQPERRVDDFPHQFSGGMRQRAMIAMALALNPKLLIADEPTTALDVTVQAQIIDLIERLQSEFNTAVIMITHDLGVVADIADEVMVMYAGKPVEFADRRTLYYQPHHPYTTGLIESIPSSTGARGRLKPIQGQPPSLITLPTGCAFHPRCPFAMDKCVTDKPPLVAVGGSGTHRSACWLPGDELGIGDAVDAERAAVAQAHRSQTLLVAGPPVITARTKPVAKTAVTKTAVAKPAVAKAPAPKTAATKTAVAKPAATKPVATKAAVANTTATKLVATKAAVAKPVAKKAPAPKAPAPKIPAPKSAAPKTTSTATPVARPRKATS